MGEPLASSAPARALPSGSPWAYRWVRLHEWVRERFWSIPAVLVLAGVITAVVVCRPDLLGLPTDWDLGRVLRIRTADTMLQVMASSMLTFVGVVFAITLAPARQLTAVPAGHPHVRALGDHQDCVRRLPRHVRVRRDGAGLRQRR